MNELERFARLAARARLERVPCLDVTGGVLRRIRLAGVARDGNLPLWVVAGVSVLAASVVLFFALDAWGPMTDPLATLFSPLTMVVQ